MAEPLFTDRALQEAYRALMKDGAAGGHLDEATWDGIAGGEIDPSARDEAFDHVVECAACSHIWRGILALKSEAEAQGLMAAAARPSTPPWRSRWVPLAIAATLVVAVAGVMLTRQSAPPGDPSRGGTTAVPPIEGLMMAYDPGGVPTLVWPPTAAAARYRIDVFSEDGRPIWSAEVAAPPARWPEATPRVKGAYRWRVEALDGDTVIARSLLTPMEIR
jgi:hypothetical protein